MRSMIKTTIILLFLASSYFYVLATAERRHVIELYNKNHQITKNIPGQNYSENHDNEISQSNENSKQKIIDSRFVPRFLKLSSFFQFSIFFIFNFVPKD